MSTLDQKLIDAHARGDTDALITLYTKAATAAEDLDSRCFFLTHAFVFALEQGDSRAETLRAQLVAHGREIPA